MSFSYRQRCLLNTLFPPPAPKPKNRSATVAQAQYKLREAILKARQPAPTPPPGLWQRIKAFWLGRARRQAAPPFSPGVSAAEAYGDIPRTGDINPKEDAR